MGAAVTVALAIGVVAFVVARLLPEPPAGPTALEAHLDRLRVPVSLELLRSREEGAGAPFFGEKVTVVRVYGSHAEPEVVCREVEAALAGWGDVLDRTAGSRQCGFFGRVIGEEHAFAVQVFSLGTGVAPFITGAEIEIRA